MPRPTTFKRCACRDPNTGRRLGNSCPKLYRAGTRSWSSSHGSWHYRLELPPTVDGRRHQLRRGGFATRTDAVNERDHVALLLRQARGDPSDARRIADLVQLALRAGKPLPDIDAVTAMPDTSRLAVPAPTVAAYLTAWLADLPVDDNTIRSYESHIRCHLIPHLGKLPLTELDAHHITAMFTTIAHHDPDAVPPKKSHGRWTGPSTRHRILATLHNALADAVDQHLIPDNPADHVHLPAAPRPKPRLWTNERVQRWRATGHVPGSVMVWTPQLTGAFLDLAQTAEPDLYPMWHLIAYRGLRRGEAVGLLDADTDLDNRQVFITNQIITLGWKPQSKPPKTSAGDRMLALDTATTQTLRIYQAQQATRRANANPPWPETGLFFTQPDGTPWHPGTVQHRFKHLVQLAGLPPVRLHDLRHGAATLAHAAGADLKDIQEMLGHCGITITADTYTSILPQHAQHLAEAIADLVPRNLPTRT